MPMDQIVVCGVPGLQYFPLYLLKGTIFKKKLLNVKCVFWIPLQPSPETFLLVRETERGMIKNLYWSEIVKYPLFLSEFNENFFQHIFETYSDIKFY